LTRKKVLVASLK